MKIAFFEIEGWEEKTIKETFPDDEVFFSREKVTPLALPLDNEFEVVSTFVNSQLSGDVLMHFPKAKFVATRSTGFDHVDLEIAKKQGIKVSYVPGYGDNTVAEFAFGLILNLTRKLYQSIDQMKENGSFALGGLRGVDIKGKNLGVVGTGRIGREVIKIAKGFGMEILAFDAFPNEEASKSLGFKYVSFEELLQNSDIITLHCPFNEQTRHLINKNNIAKIKKGAFLVNTARGGIVETDALLYAIEKEILAGVALDVLEEEGDTKDELNLLLGSHPKELELKTMLQNHMLVRMPNVLVTPHNAFNTHEALMRILKTTLENIKAYQEGKDSNLVPA